MFVPIKSDDMKKRLVLILAGISAALTLSAVDIRTGSFAPLADRSSVGIVFDFSRVLIDGMSLEEFRQSGRVDEDFEKWIDFENFIKTRFLAGVNDRSWKVAKDIIFRMATVDDEYVVIVSPLMMNIDGNYRIEFALKNNVTGEVLGLADERGDGGTFGCFSNLQGDGFEEAGEHFAKFLGKQFRAAGKKR